MNLLVWYRSLMRSVGAALVKLIATATSGFVSFTTNVIRPVKVTCEFSPVQSGTGDPSPYNVRPISGWTAAILGNTVPAPESGITFPFEPKQDGTGDPSPENVRPIHPGLTITRDDNTELTVYGGSITFNDNGTSRVESKWRPYVLNGTQTLMGGANADSGNAYAVYINTTYNTKQSAGYSDNCFCDRLKPNYVSSPSQMQSFTCQYGYNIQLHVCLSKEATGITDGMSIAQMRAAVNTWFSNNNTTVMLPMRDVIETYSLSITETQRAVEALGYTAQLLPINWQSEAGTIYGGTVTLNEDGSADLVATHGFITYDGSESWQAGTLKNSVYGSYIRNTETASIWGDSPIVAWSNMAIQGNGAYTQSSANKICATGNWLYYSVDSSVATNVDELKTFLSSNNLQVVYPLRTTTTYHFANIAQLKSFLGTNNIWHNMNGSITAEYYNKQ